MIELTTLAGMAAGLVAGLFHAHLLRRGTVRLTTWTPLWGMLRLGAVTAILVVAAISGEILAAAAGWALGFLTTCVWIVLRRLQGPVPRARTDPSEQR